MTLEITSDDGERVPICYKARDIKSLELRQLNDTHWHLVIDGVIITIDSSLFIKARLVAMEQMTDDVAEETT